MSTYEAVVIGASAGGIKALSTILSALPATFPLPIIVVQHLHPDSDSYLAYILDSRCALRVKEADEKELVVAGCVYLAPPNYHLLVEEDHTFSLSIEPRVNFSRPAVDMLFDTAVYAYRERLIGVILTGANNDGSQGLKRIKQAGGYTLVQIPETAEADAMPRAALTATRVDKVLSLEGIADELLHLVGAKRRRVAADDTDKNA